MSGSLLYHLIEDGVAYPRIFIVAGDTDPPWHERKFAARLQAANVSDAPTFHVRENGGHGWPQTSRVLGGRS